MKKAISYLIIGISIMIVSGIGWLYTLTFKEMKEEEQELTISSIVAVSDYLSLYSESIEDGEMSDQFHLLGQIHEESHRAIDLITKNSKVNDEDELIVKDYLSDICLLTKEVELNEKDIDKWSIINAKLKEYNQELSVITNIAYMEKNYNEKIGLLAKEIRKTSE